MTITAFSGPLISFGQSPNYLNESNPDLGPSLAYAGNGLLDPRGVFTYNAGQAAGAFTGGFGTVETVTLNYAPYQLSTTAIAAAAAVTNGTAMTLVSSNSTSTGISVGASCVNTATGSLVTGLVMIDAFASFTGVVASNILTASSLTGTLTVGMTLSGTGVASGTVILNQLTGPAGGAGTYTVSGNATVSSTTITGQMTGGFTAIAQQFNPPVGSIYMWNPQAMLARAVNITSTNAGATGGNFLVSGFDIYGAPMTERITKAAGATTTAGAKAFKYISSVVPQFTDAQTYSIGTSDIIGLPLRSDFFGDLVINYNATLVTASTGYTAAVTTSPATNVTGDPRGTYALQTASDGSRRLYVRQAVPLANVGSVTGLFGVTQA